MPSQLDHIWISECQPAMHLAFENMLKLRKKREECKPSCLETAWTPGCLHTGVQVRGWVVGAWLGCSSPGWSSSWCPKALRTFGWTLKLFN
jgi:hypothetical protein